MELSSYISFTGQAREAMEFYADVFGGRLEMNTFAEFGMEGDIGDQIMHASLHLPSGQTLLAVFSATVALQRLALKMSLRKKAYLDRLGLTGHGVDPDIEVIDDPAKMQNGADPQLDRAIAKFARATSSIRPATCACEAAVVAVIASCGVGSDHSGHTASSIAPLSRSGRGRASSSGWPSGPAMLAASQAKRDSLIRSARTSGPKSNS